MSRYVSWQEVIARYKKVAEDVDSAEAQTGYIDGAEATVDATLAGRYTVPFTPAPPAVKDIVIDLAYWKMIFGQEQAAPLKEYIDQRLNALACGSATLVSSAGVLTPNDPLPWSDTMNRRTVFGMDEPENYSVSADWLDDEEDKRAND